MDEQLVSGPGRPTCATILPSMAATQRLQAAGVACCGGCAGACPVHAAWAALSPGAARFTARGVSCPLKAEQVREAVALYTQQLEDIDTLLQGQPDNEEALQVGQVTARGMDEVSRRLAVALVSSCQPCWSLRVSWIRTLNGCRARRAQMDACS